MSARFVCDGCGREAPATWWPSGVPGWQKPLFWFQRQDGAGPQDACSRECVDKIASKNGQDRRGAAVLMGADRTSAPEEAAALLGQGVATLAANEGSPS